MAQHQSALLKLQVCSGLPLHLHPSLNAAAKQRILKATSGLPALTGSPLLISALPKLTAHRGKLLSANLQKGKPVHAASFIRKREIVLETELLCKKDLPQIFVHELFHFVWARLGNTRRAGYAALLADELHAHARGELGESATVAKDQAPASPNHICESFCDTAAWLYAPNPPNQHITLAPRWQKLRRLWFATHLSIPLNC